MKKIVFSLIVTCLAYVTTSAQVYYAQSGTNLHLTTSWNSDPAGTGSAPANFTTATDTFLIDDETGTVTIGANWAVSGRVIVGTGLNTVTLSTNGFTITGTYDVANNATLNVNSVSTFTIGSCATGSTVQYSGDNTQSIRAGTYHHLTLSGAIVSRIKSASGAITVNGTLTVASLNTLAMGANILSGLITSTAGAGAITTTNTSSNPLPNGITWVPDVQYNGGAAHPLPNGTYQNLTVGGTTDIKTANGSLTVNGILNVTTTNTLALGTNSLSGTFTVAGAGTISTTSTTAAIPSGLTWTTTVSYNGAGAQEVVDGTYTGFTTAGTGVKTALGNISVNGTLTIGTGTTLNLSTFILSGTIPTITFGSTTTSIIQTANTSANPIPSGRTWGGIVQYNGTSPQTVVTGTFNSLNLSGGDRTVSNTDTLFINATFTTGSGNITLTGTTIVFQGTVATQTISLAGQTSIAFATLRLRNGTTKSFTGAAAEITVNDTLNIYGGRTLALGAHRLLFGGGVVLQGNGRLNTANTTSTTPIPNLGATPWPYAVTYSAATMSVTPGIYDSLTISGTGVKTAQGNITVNDTLIISATGTIFDMGIHELAGTFIPGGVIGTLRTANTGSTPLPSGLIWPFTVNYNAASAQSIVDAISYRNLTINGGSGTKTATSNIAVLSTLNVTAGTTLDLASFTLDTVTTITNAGIIRTQSTSSNPIPSGRIIGGTFLYDGAGTQNVVKANYTNLNISGGIRNLVGDTINVSGTFTASAGTTVNGLTSMLRFSGAAQTIVLGTSGAFNDVVVIGGTKTVTTATGTFTINGNLHVDPTRTLTMNDNPIAGTLTNSGLGTITTTALTSAVPSSVTWTSLINYAGTGNQEIVGGTYNRLTLSGTGSKVANGNIDIDSALVAGALGVDMATFQLSGNILTITGTGVLRTASATLALPSGRTWPFATVFYYSTGTQDVIPGTYTGLNISGGTKNLLSGGDISVSATLTDTNGVINGGTSNLRLTGATTQTINLAGTTGSFNNFRIVAGTTKTLSAGTLTVDGELEVISGATLALGANVLSGTLTNSGAGTITSISNANPPIPSGVTWVSTVTFAGSGVNQFLPEGTYTVLNQTTGTDSLTALGDITIDDGGILNIPANQTLAMGTNQLIFVGSATITGTGIIRTRNVSANPLPDGQTWTQTVFYSSADPQTVVYGSYPTLNVAGGNRTFSTLSDVLISGTFTANTVGATYTTTASTIVFNGSGAQTITLLNPFTFNNLSCTGGGTKTIGVPVTINGNLNIADGVTLNMGTQLLSGASLTTSGGVTGILRTQNVTNPPIPTGRTWEFTVQLDGAAQTLPAGTYNGGLTLAGTGNKTAASTITVADTLTINTGRILLLAGNTLQLNGTINPGQTGTIRGSSTTSIVVGNSSTDAGSILMDQTTPGTTNVLQNLTLSRNTGADALIIGNTLRLRSLLTITDGTLNANGNLVFVSSSETQSAQIAAVTGTGAVSGDAIVQRFIPGNSDRDWRFVASSVNTTNFISNNWQQQTFITGSGTGATSCPGTHTNGFDFTSNNANSLVFWNSSTQAWNSVASTNATNLSAGTGYRFFYRGSRSQGCAALSGAGPAPADTVLVATGTLLTGNQNITCASGTGWTLVGNPYQANVDLDLVTRTNVGPIYYVYDPSFNNYRQYDASSGIGTGDFLGNGTLAPGQSVFVVSTGGGASLTFSESHKDVSATPAAMFKQNSVNGFLRLKLLSGSKEADQALLQINEVATWAKDPIDGPLFDESAPQLATYSMSDITPMGINKVGYLERGTAAPVFVDIHRIVQPNHTYSLSITDVAQFASGYKLVLVDNYLNTSTPVAEDMMYTFHTTDDLASMSKNRLQLMVENVNGKAPASPIATKELLAQEGIISIYPQPNTGLVTVSVATGNQTVKSVTLTDVTGRKVNSSAEWSAERDIKLDIQDLPSGIYFITLTGTTGSVTHKIIKQ